MAQDKKSKVGLIHVAKAKLCLTDDDYRAILRRVVGVESSKDLDDIGFTLVMEHFAGLGFKSDFQGRSFGERTGMASTRQVEMIRNLWREYTDGAGTDATLGKWLDGTFKVSALRFVTSDQARKAITALKKMKERKPRVAPAAPAAG